MGSRTQGHLLYHNHARVTGAHHDLQSMLGSVYSPHVHIRGARVQPISIIPSASMLWWRIFG